MDELKKITRICTQQAEGCSLETLLVLDSTTGQNAVNQAKLFSEAADITGIVLTKLDGTAKGGIIITIHRELGIPVKLVGVGEKIDDLMNFSAHDYAEALFISETDFTGNYERLTDDITAETADATDAVDTDDVPDEAILTETDTDDEAPEEEVMITEFDEVICDDDTSDVSDDDEITDDDELTSEEQTETENEQPAEEAVPEKKSLKDGKFGFLFKEITFGKKKKDKNE